MRYASTPSQVVGLPFVGPGGLLVASSTPPVIGPPSSSEPPSRNARASPPQAPIRTASAIDVTFIASTLTDAGPMRELSPVAGAAIRRPPTQRLRAGARWSGGHGCRRLHRRA